jgi:hypothetical protein
VVPVRDAGVHVSRLADYKREQWERRQDVWRVLGLVAARLPLPLTGDSHWTRWLDAIHQLYSVDLALAAELLKLLGYEYGRPGWVICQCRAFRRRAGFREAA